MKAAIILKDAYLENFDKNNYDTIIGADRGSLIAISNDIKLDIAIGDFDSVNEEEFNLIKKNSKRIIKLNPIKDTSDTNSAIKLVKDYDEIYLLGGIGGNRIEHLFANIIDLINYPNLHIMNRYSLIEIINDSNYQIRNDYKFISFYSLDNNTIITLKGFKYNLDNYNLKMNDSLCLSNEIIDKPYLKLNGKLLVIYSKED